MQVCSEEFGDEVAGLGLVVFLFLTGYGFFIHVFQRRDENVAHVDQLV
jgi:hypothetical protein